MLGDALDNAAQEAQQAAATKQGKKPKKAVFGQGVKTSKARATIQAAEISRVQLVLTHPAFRNDPLAALTQHLSTMYAAASLAPVSGENMKLKLATGARASRVFCCACRC
jgi:predicted GNAT family acetyltransferase